MHILFINRLAGTLIGGGETFIFNIIKQLATQGYALELLTASPVFKRGTNLSLPAKIHLVRSPFLRYWAMHYGLPHLFSALGIMLDFYCFKVLSTGWLMRLLETQKFDSIILTGFPKWGAEIQRHFGVPVIVRMPGPPSESEKQYLPLVSAVLANGDAYRQLQEVAGINLFDVPPGVDEMFFQKVSQEGCFMIKKRLGFEHKMIILFVGRLTVIKNFPMLLNAFARVLAKQKNVALLIVGEGEERRNIQKKIRQLGITDSVRLVSQQYGENLRQYYQIADVFVLTSKYDNYPNVINEAMASGLPVVATDVGGVAMQVRDGETGYLVPSGNSELFAQRVIDLLLEQDKRLAFGTRAREIVKELKWERTADQFLKIIQQICDQ